MLTGVNKMESPTFKVDPRELTFKATDEEIAEWHEAVALSKLCGCRGCAACVKGVSAAGWLYFFGKEQDYGQS